jgi:hypothetical protein
MNGRAQAAHLERGSVERGERPRVDRGGKAARQNGSLASANRWATTEVMAEPRRGATIRCRASSATSTCGPAGRGQLAGEQAERGVEVVSGEQAEHVGGNALAEEARLLR